MEFYKIPQGRPCVMQFSGGRTSGYMLDRIIEANPIWPDDAFVLFQNTGREMPETLDYVRDFGDHYKIKITWLEFREESPRFEIVGHNSASRNGEPFEALIRRRKYVPNVVTRYCSDVLKYRTAKRYMVSLGYKKWTSAIGFRADEMHRVINTKSRKHSREVIWTPLADAGITKRDVKAFWDNAPFDLNLENVKGATPLGNCDGCFLKSEHNLANLCRHYPDRAEWWSRMEKETGATFNKNWPMKALIKSVSRQPDLFLDTDKDHYCQSTHGTCETY